MLKILIKKQMTEIFRSYIYDAKKNRARSRASTVAYIVLFVLLMTVFLGGFFALMWAQICDSAHAAGMSWFYFALSGLVAVLFGTFGSVFNTYSGLYCSKDNDLLLSMPIPVHAILLSRMVSVYLMGLMYASIVFLPALIVYWVFASCTVRAVVGGLLFLFALSLLVLMLSCILGWVVARISMKLKNRNFIVVLLSLLFFAAYYFFFLRAEEMIAALVQNIALYGEQVKVSAYPVYVFGMAGTGDPFSTVLLLAVIGVLLLLLWMLLSRSFLKIATATAKIERRTLHTLAARPKSVFKSLLFREFRHFLSSPTYMLNCGFGVLMLVLVGVAFLVFGGVISEVINEAFGTGAKAFVFSTSLCLAASMVNTAAPSVSLEGKTLWLVRSLPVTSWQILCAKWVMQLWLSGAPVLFAMLCLLPHGVFSVAEFLLLAVQALLTVLFFALFNLFLSIKTADFTWTNEIVPIKQGTGVLFSAITAFAYALLYVGFYLFVGYLFFDFCAYSAIFSVVLLTLCVFLYRWLKNSGCRHIEAF